jgi:hypothetical protein
VRRSTKGDIFVMILTGDREWDAHASYHRDGKRHHAVTVDIVEPGCEPLDHPWTEIHTRRVFKDAVPWIVITVGM